MISQVWGFALPSVVVSPQAEIEEKAEAEGFAFAPQVPETATTPYDLRETNGNRRQTQQFPNPGWLGALEQRTGLREIIPQLVHRICRISKESELSAHHGLRQAEGVATEQIDMAPPQRS